MALVIRMKNVSRLLLFVGSLLVWAIAFTVVNDRYFNLDEYVLLMGATVVSLLQTWVLAAVLHT